MKNTKLSVVCVCILLFVGVQNSLLASDRKTLFNDAWKFHRGSVANAEQENYNDSKWRILDLPHDWSMDSTLVKRTDITVGAFSKYNEAGINQVMYKTQIAT